MTSKATEIRNALFVVFASFYVVASTDESFSALETLLSPRPTLRTGTATDRYTAPEDSDVENPTPEERIKEDDEEYERPLAWTRWSEWSTCSTTTMQGFRVRSRVCPKGADCYGDDIQLIKCNEERQYARSSRYKFSHKYTEQCKKKNKTEKSLSCKLYLENPELAYDIFRQNSCFFTVNRDSEDLFAHTNETTPLPSFFDADSNSTQRTGDVTIENPDAIFSVDSNRDSSLRSDNLADAKRNRRRKNDGEENDSNRNSSTYSLHVLYALIQERTCKAKCDSTMNQAARLWALGTRSSRSAENIVALLSRNGRLVTGVAVMFYEYNKCITGCHSLGTTYSMLSGKNKNNISLNGNANLKKLLLSLDGQTRQRPQQVDGGASDVESLCGGRKPGCVVTPKIGTAQERTLQRRKRQVSQQYESPCFSSENQVPPREIERKVNAELFFFEDYVQRFSCRKCRGIRRGNTGLFLPKEQVRQQRNNQPAYCRQGFLKRYALFIVENPSGRYTFSTGERFSIESRTFDVESHCEIVILK